MFSNLKQHFRRKNNEKLIYYIIVSLKWHQYWLERDERLTWRNWWLVVLMLVFGSLSAMHMFHCLANVACDRVDVIADMMVTLTVLVIAYIHVFYFLAAQRTFRDLLERRMDVNAIRDFEDVNLKANLVGFGNLIFVYAMCTATVIFIIFSDAETGLIFPAYSPFIDFNAYPYNKLCGMLQIISVSLSDIVTVAMAVLGITPCVYLIEYLKQLAERLGAMPLLRYRYERHKLLRQCVRFHRSIFDLAECYNNAVRYIFVALIMFGSVLIGLSLCGLLLHFDYTKLLNLVGFFFTVLFICSFGERLIQQSTHIADVCYDIMPFEAGDVRTQRDLLIVMQRGARAIFVDGGGIAVMRHALFMTIMKSTYSIITLLFKME